MRARKHFERDPPFFPPPPYSPARLIHLPTTTKLKTTSADLETLDFQNIHNLFGTYSAWPHARDSLAGRGLPPTSRRSIGDATETSIADSSGLRILSPFSGLASALWLRVIGECPSKIIITTKSSLTIPRWQ